MDFRVNIGYGKREKTNAGDQDKVWWVTEGTLKEGSLIERERGGLENKETGGGELHPRGPKWRA
jgi:hypothetical protein